MFKISWISIEFVAEHIVEMLLKHFKKCTAAEIPQLVKLMKQEIAALEKSSNKMAAIYIEREPRTFIHVKKANRFDPVGWFQ